MRNSNKGLLLHPVFLLCLGGLLLNDFYLKEQYHNWLTGKLSDITGLIAFILFCYAVLPAGRKKIMLAVTLFFLWWKSPLSESLITFFNNRLLVPIERTVDYSDYLALLFLPLTYGIRTFQYRESAGRTALLYCSSITAFFAFCATSGPYRHWYNYYRENEIPFYESVNTKMTDKEILNQLDPRHLGWSVDSIRYLPLADQQRLFIPVLKPGDSLASWVAMTDSLASPLYYKSVSSPYYILPEYFLDGDTLHQLEFSISRAQKSGKATISFHSFRSTNKEKYAGFMYTNLTGKYKKHFRKLLKGK